MALARLALKNLQQRVSQTSFERSLSNVQKQRWGYEVVNRFSTTTSTAGDDEKQSDQGKEVTVADEGGKKSNKLFPRKNRKRSLWRKKDHDFVPSLNELFPSRLGNALMQATENINSLFEKLSPRRLIGRVKEKDECYKLKFHVPGLAKEDVKITVENGILTIEGEHKEEETSDEEEDHEEYWYGYYNTSLLLPEDAKADEIKAEMKHGVLIVTIPRTESPNKDVKEVEIQ